MIIAIERDVLTLEETAGILEGGNAFGFTYKSAPAAAVADGDILDEAGLGKLTALADFVGDEGGVRFYYDNESKIYAVKLNADQNVAGQDGKAELFEVPFKGAVTLEDGATYKLAMEGSSMALRRDGEYNPAPLEDLGSRMNMQLINNVLKAKEIKTGDTVAEAETAAAEESQAEETQAEESRAEETQAEATQAPEAAKTEAGETAAEETAEAETEAETQQVITTIGADTQAPSDNGTLIWAIGATVAAVAAIAFCGFLLSKLSKSGKNKKTDSAQLASLQRTLDDKSSAYEKLQKRAKELEGELEEANAAFNELQEETISRAASTSAELENRPSAEDLDAANARAEKLQQQYDEMYTRNRQLMNEREQYIQKIRELENGAKASAAAAAVTPAEETASGSTDGINGILLSTSEKELEKYADAQYLAPATSMTADGVTLSRAPVRRAPIVVIGNEAYLNPYFFRDLGKGMESYSNLTGVKAVFETEGLSGASVKYGLSAIIPAAVSYDAASGTYRVDKTGHLVLKIG